MPAAPGELELCPAANRDCHSWDEVPNQMGLVAGRNDETSLMKRARDIPPDDYERYFWIV